MTIPNALDFFKLKVDIIQIQQWLTDISATRAAPGFDDGYDEAKKAYDDANKILNELMHQFTNAGDVKMTQTLKIFQSDMLDYYNVGKKMANAYIVGGPESGNKLMEELDPFAEKLAEKLQK
ncbi:MAG: hypothetical protein FAF05_05315 [Epsilonproteobacteria bacterium]|nr:hypothetical protein [Campylobacterota bacterium]